MSFLLLSATWRARPGFTRLASGKAHIDSFLDRGGFSFRGMKIDTADPTSRIVMDTEVSYTDGVRALGIVIPASTPYG
jgi:hypothetical protein